MRRAATLLLLSAVACARGPSGPSAQPTAVFPLRATGLDTAGAIVESLQGTVHVFPDEVRIVLSEGVARLGDTPTFRAMGLSGGLGYRHANGGWDFRRQTEVVPIRDIPHRGDTLTGTLTFRIRGTSGLDLKEHWVIVQQHGHRRDASTGLWHQVTRPLNSAPDVFRGVAGQP